MNGLRLGGLWRRRRAGLSRLATAECPSLGLSRTASRTAAGGGRAPPLRAAGARPQSGPWRCPPADRTRMPVRLVQVQGWLRGLAVVGGGATVVQPGRSFWQFAEFELSN